MDYKVSRRPPTPSFIPKPWKRKPVYDAIQSTLLTGKSVVLEFDNPNLRQHIRHVMIHRGYRIATKQVGDYLHVWAVERVTRYRSPSDKNR